MEKGNSPRINKIGASARTALAEELPPTFEKLPRTMTQKKNPEQQDPNGIILNARIRIAAILMSDCLGDDYEDEAIQALTKADILIQANNKYPFGSLVEIKENDL